MTTAPKGWGYTRPVELLVAPRAAARARTPRNLSQCRMAQISYWLGSLHEVPSVDEIRQRWGVARATAYRYRAFALSGGSVAVQPAQTNPHRKLPRKSA